MTDCAGSTCGGLGATCTVTGSDNLCAMPLVCNGATGKCVQTVGNGTLYSPCSSYTPNPVSLYADGRRHSPDCMPGLVCLQSPLNLASLSPYVCLPTAAAHEPCATTAQCQLVSPQLTCSNMTGQCQGLPTGGVCNYASFLEHVH